MLPHMYITSYSLCPDVIIGFEETEVDVYESSRSVRICARILHPTSTSGMEDVNFDMQFSTESNTSKL